MGGEITLIANGIGITKEADATLGERGGGIGETRVNESYQAFPVATIFEGLAKFIPGLLLKILRHLFPSFIEEVPEMQM